MNDDSLGKYPRTTRRELIAQLVAVGGISSMLPGLAHASPAMAMPSQAALEQHFRDRGIGTIGPTDPAYDIWRQVYDRRADKRPLAILQCASVAHVQETLKFAHEHAIPVAVRGGGHGFTGRSTIDAGLLIDLGLMNDVSTDYAARTVRVGPGVRNGQLLAVTAPAGFAPVTTSDNHIGVIGAALFAGQGYLSPLYGNMCDNVLALEVVLADGSLARVSATEHPDLFWAMRGAGDNFGVVTSMTMRLHPIPQAVTCCYFEYDAVQHGREVMRQFRDRSWASPTPWLLGNLVLDAKTKQPRIGYLFALIGDEAQTKADLEAVERFAPAGTRNVNSMGWLELHDQLGLPPNNRFYIAQKDLHWLDDDCIGMMLDEIQDLSRDPEAPKPINGTPCAIIFFYPTDGGMGRQPVPPNSYSLRGGYDLEAVAIWSDRRESKHHEAWAEGLIERFHQRGKAIKPSVLANSTVDERVTRMAFGHDYHRLLSLKRKYDPRGVFSSTTAVIAS